MISQQRGGNVATSITVLYPAVDRVSVRCSCSLLLFYLRVRPCSVAYWFVSLLLFLLLVPSSLSLGKPTTTKNPHRKVCSLKLSLLFTLPFAVRVAQTTRTKTSSKTHGNITSCYVKAGSVVLVASCACYTPHLITFQVP